MIQRPRLMVEDLGNILREDGTLTNDQLMEARSHVARNGGEIGDAVVGLGYLQESDIVMAISR